MDEADVAAEGSEQREAVAEEDRRPGERDLVDEVAFEEGLDDLAAVDVDASRSI